MQMLITSTLKNQLNPNQQLSTKNQHPPKSRKINTLINILNSSLTGWVRQAPPASVLPVVGPLPAIQQRIQGGGDILLVILWLIYQVISPGYYWMIEFPKQLDFHHFAGKQLVFFEKQKRPQLSPKPVAHLESLQAMPNFWKWSAGGLVNVESEHGKHAKLQNRRLNSLLNIVL